MLAELLQSTASRLRRVAPERMPWDTIRPHYERAIRVLSGSGFTIRMPGGEHFRFDPSLHRIDFGEAECWDWLRSVIRPKSIFYDAGAFVGHYSLLGAQRGAEVYSFEPWPENYRLLGRHIALNGFASQIHPSPFAIGDHDGEVTFYIRGTGTYSSNSIAFARDGLQYVDHAALGTMTVPLRHVDSIIAETGRVPDVIKIDVEGAEERVLRGAVDLLRTQRPLVLCAIHPFWMVGLGDSPDSLKRFLESVHYRAYSLTGQRKSEFGFEEVLFLPH